MWAKCLAVIVAAAAVGGAGYYYATPDKRHGHPTGEVRLGTFTLTAGGGGFAVNHDTPESRSAALAACVGTTTMVNPSVAQPGPSVRAIRAAGRLDD